MSIKCTDFKPLLEEYFTDKLSQSAQDRFEEHLKECPGCLREFESHKRIHSRLAAEGPMKAPRGLHSKIMARVSSSTSLPTAESIPAKPSFWPGGIVIGIVTAGIIGSIWLSNPQTSIPVNKSSLSQVSVSHDPTGGESSASSTTATVSNIQATHSVRLDKTPEQ